MWIKRKTGTSWLLIFFWNPISYAYSAKIIWYFWKEKHFCSDHDIFINQLNRPALFSIYIDISYLHGLTRLLLPWQKCCWNELYARISKCYRSYQILNGHKCFWKWHFIIHVFWVLTSKQALALDLVNWYSWIILCLCGHNFHFAGIP